MLTTRYGSSLLNGVESTSSSCLPTLYFCYVFTSSLRVLWNVGEGKIFTQLCEKFSHPAKYTKAIRAGSREKTRNERLHSFVSYSTERISQLFHSTFNSKSSSPFTVRLVLMFEMWVGARSALHGVEGTSQISHETSNSSSVTFSSSIYRTTKRTIRPSSLSWKEKSHFYLIIVFSLSHIVCVDFSSFILSTQQNMKFCLPLVSAWVWGSDSGNFVICSISKHKFN